MTKLCAEIGTHHMGDMRLGRRMIDLARENGADMVKFQLFDTEKLTHWPTPDIKAEAKRCELTFEQALVLFKYGENTGIEVFFSVFDPEKVDWCEKIGVKTYKIAANMHDIDVCKAVDATGKPLIISRAMIAVDDRPNRPVDLSILWCPPGYPQKPSKMPYFGQYGNVGYSDHTIGIDAAKIAIARGAYMIEKHFALDHQTGMDARWSMTPAQLKELRRWTDLVQSYRQD